MSAQAKVVSKYLDAFTSGDLDAAYGLVSDDFSFRGPMLQSDGKEQFVAGSKGLAPIVNGYTMLRQFTEGIDVCSIYEFHVETPKGSGTVLMTEWNTVEKGKLTSSRLVFDTAAFQALM